MPPSGGGRRWGVTSRHTLASGDHSHTTRAVTSVSRPRWWLQGPPAAVAEEAAVAVAASSATTWGARDPTVVRTTRSAANGGWPQRCRTAWQRRCMMEVRTGAHTRFHVCTRPQRRAHAHEKYKESNNNSARVVVRRTEDESVQQLCNTNARTSNVKKGKTTTKAQTTQRPCMCRGAPAVPTRAQAHTRTHIPVPTSC